MIALCMYAGTRKYKAARDVLRKLPPDSVEVVKRNWRMMVKIWLSYMRKPEGVLSSLLHPPHRLVMLPFL